jgi:hypothetical protein
VHPAPRAKRVRMAQCVSIDTTVETAPNATAAPRLRQTGDESSHATPSPAAPFLRRAGSVRPATQADDGPTELRGLLLKRTPMFARLVE